MKLIQALFRGSKIGSTMAHFVWSGTGCQLKYLARPRHTEPVCSLPNVNFFTVSIDFTSLLPRLKGENGFLLVCIEGLSSWLSEKAVSNAANVVRDFLLRDTLISLIAKANWEQQHFLLHSCRIGTNLERAWYWMEYLTLFCTYIRWQSRTHGGNIKEVIDKNIDWWEGWMGRALTKIL